MLEDAHTKGSAKADDAILLQLQQQWCQLEQACADAFRLKTSEKILRKTSGELSIRASNSRIASRGMAL